MDGIITSAGTLSGSISAEQALTGSLSSVGTLDGNMTCAAQTLTPIYGGDYSFTPSESAQTVEINGKRAEDDILIGAIPSEYVVPTGSQTVTRNDTYDVKSLAEMVVNVPTAEVQSKSVTPTESEQTITPDDGYVGMDSVTVGAISSSYVGSGVTRNDSTDLTASGNTVTAPAGYYSEAASKAVAGGSATTPATTITANPTISVDSATGVITATASKTQSVTPTVSAGYVSSGTAGTITVSGSNTSNLSTVNGATVSPTESEQTAVAANKYTLGAVKVGAISSSYVGSGVARKDSTNLSASGATVTVPSGYYSSNATKTVASGTAGTPTATKGSVSNHSVSVTPSVTNTSGYISGGTINGTAVTVSASELVSGTYTVDSSGTKDVTNYASASVPAGTAGTPSASKGAVSNHSVSVTPSVTNTTGWITGSTKTGTAVSVSASELVSGNLAISQNGTGIDVTNYETVSVDVQGGGGSDVQIGYGDVIDIPSATSSISFTGLSGNPTSFIVYYNGNLATPSGTPYKIACLVYDGTDIHGQTITNTNNAQVTYDGSSFSKSYSSGTLTLSSSGAYFQAGDYYITYSYDGTASNVKTADVQVGSGATSITFTGLEDEPLYWSCIFKSNFSTSSGYQRVIFVTDIDGELGMAMDSRANLSGAWTASYNNGSFTITSSGTNSGGYFHQPGYYQLTYAISGDQSLQTKTVTPTTSTQNVTADTGYTALKKVVVEPIPSSYVQPTTTVGATTYRASTSSQTIQSGTYHSAAATIAAVSQTNLEAGNIKSGTTITISNGQSNLWSVTGTYTGGGGTSKNVQVLQSTSRTNSSSLTKVLGDLTVSKTGTYDIYWSGGRSNTSSSYTWGTRLYVDGSGYGTENTSWTNNCQSNHLSNVSLTANQKLSVYSRGRSGSYYTFVPMLVIIEA